jgi:hypothetical protein
MRTKGGVNGALGRLRDALFRRRVEAEPCPRCGEHGVVLDGYSDDVDDHFTVTCETCREWAIRCKECKDPLLFTLDSGGEVCRIRCSCDG